ncbi:MAG: phage major capsid protein [Patescibacteria group bacterium]|nr:phage major capsid protein [Patescibacteria group bacterium]
MSTPIFGTGGYPDPGPVANELTAVTRRAYSPHVYVQIYNTSALTAALLDNAQTMSGGVNPITVPIQGVPMVTIQNLGYDASFDQPGVTPGLDVAQFNPAWYFSAIPFPITEGFAQLNYAIVPIIEARMNDCAQQYKMRLASDIYTNINNLQAIVGLNGAVDDGTFLVNYGGQSRTTNTWWQSTYVAAGSVALTRDLTNKYLLQQQKKNELPKLGVCGAGTWYNLSADFTSLERYNITPSSDFGMGTAGAKFRAIEVAGVPIYMDPQCPEGTLYLLNPDYLSLYVHERGAFEVLPFVSRQAVGQLGYLGGVLLVSQLACVKPAAQMKVTGLTYASI